MDYRKGQFVSVWMGQFVDEASLLAFVRQDFRSSPPRSRFGSAFGLGRFDEDMREAAWIADLGEGGVAALEGFSYLRSFLGELDSDLQQIGYAGYNAVIMLYDFDYTPPTVTAFATEGAQVRYVGSYSYVF